MVTVGGGFQFEHHKDAERYFAPVVMSTMMHSREQVQRYEPLIDIVAVAFQLYVMQGVTWKVYRKSIVRSVIISFENEQDFEIRVSCVFRKHMARMQEIMLEGGYVISTTPEDRDLIDRVITFFESPFTGVSYEIMPRMSDPTATCLQTRVNCTD